MTACAAWCAALGPSVPRFCRCGPLMLGAAVYQIEQDALAHAAVGDAELADRPGRADRVEDRAAAEHQVGALAADAGARRAAGEVEPGQMARHLVDLREGERAAVDHRADVARQSEMNAGQRRHRARAADHLHAPRYIRAMVD